MTEKIKTEPEQKNSVTPVTPDKVCDQRCKICSSDFLITIHELKKAGNKLSEIVNIAKRQGFEISKASLSRHFTCYYEHKNKVAAQIINNDLLEEATKQSAHTKKIVELIDKALAMIKARIEAGTLVFDIADLEKLMKLRYQVMSGQDTDENDILAIFQKASDKYGVNMQQGVLFGNPPLKAQEAGQE